MKKTSTLFLRLAIAVIVAIILAVCIFALPAGIRSPHAGAYRYLLLAMYLPAIPFLIGAYQAIRILGLIDHGQAFSTAAVRALKIVIVCAAIIGLFYAALLPFMYSLAGATDAPGILLIGLVFTFGPLAVAAVGSVLQQLLADTITLKSENDLTV